jgi:predicted transposase/invertase (TIGR01784 family)
LPYTSENDVTLRERYAWEILNMTSDQEYDKKRRKYILEFAHRIFGLSDPQISPEIREAYKMKTISLSDYALIIAKEEGLIEGMEKGMEKGKEEMAKNLLSNGIPPDVIAKSAGLPLEKIQAFVNP